MSILKSLAIAGAAAASLVVLAPAPHTAAYDYISAYGMYQRNGLWHSSNGYIEYIIQHESSGRPWVTNYLGCIGLMQSCPYMGHAPELAVWCPNWASDVNCQLAWGTHYANSRYGGFYGSWIHEKNFGWW